MNKIERLKNVVKLYNNGQYDIDTFADVFSCIYSAEENSNCDEKELEKYRELYKVTARYSPYKEDLISYPKVYSDKKDVLKVLEKLKDM